MRPIFLLLLGMIAQPNVSAATPESITPFPPPTSSYVHPADAKLLTILVERAQQQPFNLIATLLFLGAILHTFFAPALTKQANRLHHAAAEISPGRRMTANLLHYLGEIEIVFGLWALVLFVALIVIKGYATAQHYVNHQVSYIEPIFVVVIMTIAASRPILKFAQKSIARCAGSSPAGWWLSILTIGPILGSFITEPAAMTISALLLAREFYRYAPSPKFQYATLGLLFVNISVGGTLTHFAAPPVLMVASIWQWDTPFMLLHFGIRAILGVILCNAAYFFWFQSEFKTLAARKLAGPSSSTDDDQKTPVWVTVIHLIFLANTVWVAHDPALAIANLLFFLAFTTVTEPHQGKLDIRPPLLVGFFLAGLVVHGGLQAWWIEPVLGRLGEVPLLLGSTLLTAFNDNAAITYLASRVPNFSEPLKFAVMSGALCGGGLTVIANAPNPAGQSILSRFFPDGINPFHLLLGALFPTTVMLLCFSLFR